MDRCDIILMSSIVLTDTYTTLTESFDEVKTKTFDNGKQYLYRYTYNRKKLTNVDQLDHIINYLVIEKGFMMNGMDKFSITFTCPTNTDIHYNYYPSTMDFEKVSEKFLMELE
jgi:hypothetical protein